MSNYSELLKDPRWQRKRLEIMNRDNWRCCACNRDVVTLNVHHTKYSGKPWEADASNLITLCENCHKLEEAYKKDNTTLGDLSNKSGVLATFLIDAAIVMAHKIRKDRSSFNEIKDYIKNNDDEIFKMIENG